MDTQPTIIEYSNCQWTKGDIIKFFIISISFIIAGSAIGTIIGCGVSSECSEGLFVSMLCSGSIFAIIFVIVIYDVLTTWCYNHNNTIRDMIDEDNMRIYISQQIKGKNKEELESIQKFISEISSV